MSKDGTVDRILVVDDSAPTVEIIQRNLEGRGCRVFTAVDVAEAMKILESIPVDLVITDLKMPGASGLDLIVHVRKHHPDTEVIMITGYATVEGAVDAMKCGAQEYLSKPFTGQELNDAVDRALENLAVHRAATARTMPTPRSPHGIIGESEPMQAVYRIVAKAARSMATVLIYGESGTGKELVARAIHYSSERKAAPFVAVNCGGIPEGLLESELFGHVKGAFSGAVEDREGFFQAASGGTIFLDEIGEMSLAMQVKLLRVIQEREICMVGSSTSKKVDVRILAATNKNLPAAVEKGGFREDLYYRLNVIAVDLPPLRERGDDILLLIDHFLKKYNGDGGEETPRFTDSALKALRKHPWSGNVRALENVVHRLMVMADSPVIDVPDLPALVRERSVREVGFGRTLAEVEADYIRNVLSSVDGNKTRAAQILDIDRKTLREKLKKIE